VTPRPSPQPTSCDGGPRLIAIASGKGGVGKTWLAITLSHALAMAGRRVLLVDADLGLANVDVQLGLEPADGLPAVLSGRSTVADAARPHPAMGFDILAGCSGSGALAGLDEAAHRRLLAALREAGSRWQDVVLDLGAGLDRGVRALAAGADLLLVVATAEPTSLTDAYAVLKFHRRDRPRGDARLVVNQAVDREQQASAHGGASTGPAVTSSAVACGSPVCCGAIPGCRSPSVANPPIYRDIQRHNSRRSWMRCGLR
jgi:MinD-like ATPase involved in chromosome partitioning or flagellar assembly